MKVYIPRDNPPRKKREKLSRSEIVQRLEDAAAHLFVAVVFVAVATGCYWATVYLFPKLDEWIACAWFSVLLGAVREVYLVFAALAGHDEPH